MRTDTAWLMGNYFGSALWGIYSTLFFVAIWPGRKRRADGFHSPVIRGVIVLFILNLGLTGFYATTTYEAFNTTDRSATAFLSGMHGYAIVTVTDFSVCISVTIADLILAWRVYVIYSRSIRMLAAILVLILGTTVCGIGIFTYNLLIITCGPNPLYVLQQLRLVVVGVSLSVGFNWTVTGLIVTRLWWASKQLTDNSFICHYDGAETKQVTQTYRKLIFILIESGAFYSAVCVIWIITYVMGDSWNLAVFAIPITPRVIALFPTLIVLQRSLGYMHTSESPAAALSNVEFAVPTTQSCGATLLASVTRNKEELGLASIPRRP